MADLDECTEAANRAERLCKGVATCFDLDYDTSGKQYECRCDTALYKPVVNVSGDCEGQSMSYISICCVRFILNDST